MGQPGNDCPTTPILLQSYSTAHFLEKRRHSRSISTQNKRVDAFGALRRAHGLQIAKVTDDMVIRQDAAAAQDVPGHTSDLHRFPHVVQLGHGYLGVTRPGRFWATSVRAGLHCRIRKSDP